MNKIAPLQMVFWLQRSVVEIFSLLLLGVMFTLANYLPAKAELNASYSVGDILIATYKLPQNAVGGVVRLASQNEYEQIGADTPQFYGNINVIERNSVVGKLFLSTNVIVRDPNFDLVFVQSSTGNIVDWFRLEAVNGGAVRIQDMKNAQPTTPLGPRVGQGLSEPFRSENKEMLALLKDVSRQLRTAQSAGGASPEIGTPVAPKQSFTPPQKAQRQQPPVSTTPPSNPVTLPVEPATFAVIPSNIVSETQLASVDMKNFILTILVVALALMMVVAIVLYKTRQYVSSTPAPQTAVPQGPYPSNDQATASLGFLNYLKEENQRAQQSYLKSIEFLVSSLKTTQPAPVNNAQHNEPIPEAAQNDVAGNQRPGLRMSATNPLQAPVPRQTVAPQPAKVEGSEKTARPIPTAKTAEPISAQVKEKFDLAEVYKNMGDVFMAQSLLQEVLKTGNQTEIAHARDLLKKLGEA